MSFWLRLSRRNTPGCAYPIDRTPSHLNSNPQLPRPGSAPAVPPNAGGGAAPGARPGRPADSPGGSDAAFGVPIVAPAGNRYPRAAAAPLGLITALAA